MFDLHLGQNIWSWNKLNISKEVHLLTPCPELVNRPCYEFWGLWRQGPCFHRQWYTRRWSVVDNERGWTVLPPGHTSGIPPTRKCPGLTRPDRRLGDPPSFPSSCLHLVQNSILKVHKNPTGPRVFYFFNNMLTLVSVFQYTE